MILHVLSLFAIVQQGSQHADHIWPAGAFCAARDAFLEFSNN